MRLSLAKRHIGWGLQELLDRYPGLRRRPSESGDLVLVGNLGYEAAHASFGTVADSFELEFQIPPTFPKSIPRVRETARRIPESYHRLSHGELCLGSPLRLKVVIAEDPTLLGFVERCVLPYLIKFTVYERTG